MTDMRSGVQPGVRITAGVCDWQVLQLGSAGTATLAVSGLWSGEPDDPGLGSVQVRVVAEATGLPPTTALDWQDAAAAADGTWSARLEVPAGATYRVESRHIPPALLPDLWGRIGDCRHFVGAGDIWVIAGQSNAAGYGMGPVWDPPELGVHLLANSLRWRLASHPLNDATDTAHPANREGSNPAHSPFLQVGKLLQRALGYPIGLVATSLGGSPLSEWTPAPMPGAPGGVLLANLADCIAAAGGRIAGIFWYQGETDAGEDETADTYRTRFARAVAAWREVAGDPALPVVTVQLNRLADCGGPDADRRWSVIREAQRRAARELPGVFVVPALDLPLSDPIHTSAAGNMLLAQRLAAAVLGGVHAHPIPYLAPEIQTATRVGNEVLLRFANVTTRLAPVLGSGHGFRVVDAAGEVPVVRVEYRGHAEVVLRCGRGVVGGAVVHGAWGQDPGPVPFDIGRGMPMLAFADIPID